MTDNKKLIAKTFYTFFVNGFMALMIGSIMPFIIKDYKINYIIAGTFISFHSIGNLSASFIAPVAIRYLGRHSSIICLSSLLVLSYFGIASTGNIPLLYFLFFLTGVGRGSISNVNNAIINDAAAGKSAILNLLHTFFAIGAFLTPIIASFVTGAGYSWKIVVFIGVGFSISAVVTYFFMDIDIKKAPVGTVENNNQIPYYKNFDFYAASFLLFFYLGVETAVNGWLVTYFKDTGIMSAGFAQSLLSLLWVVIILGRLSTAYLSSRLTKQTLILFNTIGASIFVVMLMFNTNILIVSLSITLFGFFLAGIYPTTIASVGVIIKSSPSAMAILLAFSGLGGITMPFIIGVVSQKKGIQGGMSLIIVDMCLALLLAVIIFVRNKKKPV